MRKIDALVKSLLRSACTLGWANSEKQMIEISSEVVQEKQDVTFKNWTSQTAVEAEFELDTSCLLNDTSICYSCVFQLSLFGVTSGKKSGKLYCIYFWNRILFAFTENLFLHCIAAAVGRINLKNFSIKSRSMKF